MKLYPPYIEGTLPAFSIVPGQKATISIPFAMNKAVGTQDFDSLSLKVKTINSSDYLFEVLSDGYDLNTNHAFFTLTRNDVSQLNIGQYYKFQLAYVQSGDSNSYGFYSTVGVTKCTSVPTVTIDNLNRSKLNPHSYHNVGRYIKEDDPSEKVASYCFTVYDEDLNVVKTTGNQIHNNETNPSTHECFDTQDFLFDLGENKIYYIQYSIITTNNLVVDSPKYRIIQNEGFDLPYEFEVIPEINYDNSYIDVRLKSKNDQRISGTFIVSRSSSDTNFKEWYQLATIQLQRETPSRFSKRDFNIEQGKYYKYCVQQYNNKNTYSKRVCSEPIFADFECVFLYDGEKQLRLPFNTTIGSFKTDLLESKIETIGSQYPFFYKNGSVKYKEFNINSLISYLSDAENLFNDVYKTYDSTRQFTWVQTPDQMIDQYQKRVNTLNIQLHSDNSKWVRFRAHLTEEQLAALEAEYTKTKQLIKYVQKNRNREQEIKDTIEEHDYQTTLLTAYNYRSERRFKLEVLDWLNDGKIKLFKSPSEGNYLVRLMNVSLSPEEKLGRLIHSFSCQAYECDDLTYDNLIKYGILKVEQLEPELTWGQADLSSPNYAIGEGYDEINDTYESLYINEETNEIMKVYDGSVAFNCGELLPAGRTVYSVFFRDMLPGTIVKIDDNEVIIGATGSYQVFSEDGINSIFIPNNDYYTGSVTYTYYDIIKNDFCDYIGVGFKDIPCEQYIGKHNDVISSLNDIKTEVQKIYYIRGRKRNIIRNVYENPEDGKIYYSYNASTDTYSNEATDVLPIYLVQLDNYVVGKDLTTGKYLADSPQDLIDLVNLGYDNLEVISNTVELNPTYNPVPLSDLNQDNYQEMYLFNEETGEYELADRYDRTLQYYWNDLSIIDLSETHTFEVKDPDIKTEIQIGNGVYVEIGYKAKIYTYTIEDEPEDPILRNYQNQLYRAEEIIYDASNFMEEVAIENFTDKLQQLLLEAINQLEIQKTDGTITTEAYTTSYNTYANQYFFVSQWYDQYIEKPYETPISTLLSNISIDTSEIIGLLAVSDDLEESRDNYAAYYAAYIERLEFLLQQ